MTVETKFAFGDAVTDRVSDFKGIVVGIYIRSIDEGHDRYEVQKVLASSDDKYIEPVWFDEERLEKM